MFDLGSKSNMNHGFRMTFANGWTISVRWGTSNYCENKDRGDLRMSSAITEDYMSSKDAEIMVRDASGESHYLSDSDEVVGWQSTEQVLALMVMAASKDRDEPGYIPEEMKEFEEYYRAQRKNYGELPL